MVELVARWGFGNILFQYAAARHLALKLGTTLNINLVSYLGLRDPWGRRLTDNLQLMHLKASFSRPWLRRLGRYYIKQEMGPRGGNVYRERGYGYDPGKLAELSEAVRPR